MKKETLVIDYGMGNLWSVLNALRYLGKTARISADPEAIAAAHQLILPGVGSFRKAMETLRSSGLGQAIQTAVLDKGSRILGICLGMQLLGSSGTEDGFSEGLGLVPNRVEKFTSSEVGSAKIPHVGFNSVKLAQSSGFFAGLSANADFYFVHSYRMMPEKLTGNLGICHYGTDFLAAFHEKNIYGTQFHPEKSQTNGLQLLNNFLENDA